MVERCLSRDQFLGLGMATPMVPEPLRHPGHQLPAVEAQARLALVEQVYQEIANRLSGWGPLGPWTAMKATPWVEPARHAGTEMEKATLAQRGLYTCFALTILR